MFNKKMLQKAAGAFSSLNSAVDEVQSNLIEQEATRSFHRPFSGFPVMFCRFQNSIMNAVQSASNEVDNTVNSTLVSAKKTVTSYESQVIPYENDR